MKKMHYFSIILIAIICITGICGADVSNPAVVILKSGDEPFWNQIKTGIENASDELGFPVSILTPEVPYQSDEMVVLAFEAIEQSPSVLVITPSDTSLFDPALKAAAKADTPVLILESPVTSDIPAGYIGSDNNAIGVMAADDIADLLNGKGAVVILSRDGQDPGSSVRAEAFINQVEKKYSGIKTATGSLDDETDLDQYIGSLLRDNPEINGIFSTDGETTLALGQILKTLDVDNQIAVIGVDGGDDAKALVTEGILQEIIVQDPYQMGYITGELINALLTGEDINPETVTNITAYVSDVPLVVTTVVPTATITPASDNSQEGLSYEEKLQAAADRYDFGSMAEQTANSHYSTVNQIAQEQANLASAMSSSSSGSSGHWCPTCGSGLVWVEG